jgi:hypothetical protein
LSLWANKRYLHQWNPIQTLIGLNKQTNLELLWKSFKSVNSAFSGLSQKLSPQKIGLRTLSSANLPQDSLDVHHIYQVAGRQAGGETRGGQSRRDKLKAKVFSFAGN